MDPSLISAGALTAFVEILFIDIVLAGDNAIVVGALAADPAFVDHVARHPQDDG